MQMSQINFASACSIKARKPQIVLNHQQQKLSNYLQLQINQIQQSLVYLQNEHSPSELKLTIQKIYTFFYSTQQFFQNNAAKSLKFVYEYHRKTLQFFTTILFNLLDEQQALQLAQQNDELAKKSKTNKKKKKFECVKLTADQMESSNTKAKKIFEVSSNQSKQVKQFNNEQSKQVIFEQQKKPNQYKKIKANKMGGVYLFNQDYKRNLQILPKFFHQNYFSSELDFKEQKNKQFRAEIKKQIQQVQTREQAQARYERQQIDLFMRQHRPLVTGVKKMLCGEQLSGLQSLFKESHQSALQFLKSSKIDYLGKAECIGNFNSIYLDYEQSKKNHISDINTKVTQLFQIIKAKELQLQQACSCYKQKIKLLEEKINRKTNTIETQTFHDFRAQFANMRFKYLQLQEKFNQLQNQKRMQVGINLSDFTKQKQFLNELNDKKFMLKKLQKTISQQNENIDKMKKEIIRLGAKNSKSASKQSFLTMNQQEQMGLVKQLFLYCQDRGVIRKQSLNMDLLKRESINILKAFSKPHIDLSFASNNKIQPYLPSRQLISSQSIEGNIMYKKKKQKKAIKLEKMEKLDAKVKLAKQNTEQIRTNLIKNDQNQQSANYLSIKIFESSKNLAKKPLPRREKKQSITSFLRNEKLGTQNDITLKPTSSFTILDEQNKSVKFIKTQKVRSLPFANKNMQSPVSVNNSKYFTPLKIAQKINSFNNIKNSIKVSKDIQGRNGNQSIHNKKYTQQAEKGLKRANKTVHERRLVKKQSMQEYQPCNYDQTQNIQPIQQANIEQQSVRIHHNLGMSNSRTYTRAKFSYVDNQQFQNNLIGNNRHLGVKNSIKKSSFQPSKFLTFNIQKQLEKKQLDQQNFLSLSRKVRGNTNYESKGGSQHSSDSKEEEFNQSSILKITSFKLRTQEVLKFTQSKGSLKSQASRDEQFDKSPMIKRLRKNSKAQSRFRPYPKQQKGESVEKRDCAKILPIHKGNIDKNQIEAMKIALTCQDRQQFRRKMIIIHMQRCGKYCNHLKRFCQNFQKYKNVNTRKTAPVHIKNIHEDSTLKQQEQI